VQHVVAAALIFDLALPLLSATTLDWLCAVLYVGVGLWHLTAASPHEELISCHSWYQHQCSVTAIVRCMHRRKLSMHLSEHSLFIAVGLEMSVSVVQDSHMTAVELRMERLS
jgi:hypothetical protein